MHARPCDQCGTVVMTALNGKSFLCPACYAGSRNAKNSKRAHGYFKNLPEFEGSAKQRNWAEQIRARTICESVIPIIESQPEGPRSLIRSIHERVLRRMTDAKWWIDNREIICSELGELFTECMEEEHGRDSD